MPRAETNVIVNRMSVPLFRYWLTKEWDRIAPPKTKLSNRMSVDYEHAWIVQMGNNLAAAHLSVTQLDTDTVMVRILDDTEGNPFTRSFCDWLRSRWNAETQP